MIPIHHKWPVAAEQTSLSPERRCLGPVVWRRLQAAIAPSWWNSFSLCRRRRLQACCRMSRSQLYSQCHISAGRTQQWRRNWADLLNSCYNILLLFCVQFLHNELFVSATNGEMNQFLNRTVLHGTWIFVSAACDCVHLTFTEESVETGIHSQKGQTNEKVFKHAFICWPEEKSISSIDSLERAALWCSG